MSVIRTSVRPKAGSLWDWDTQPDPIILLEKSGSRMQAPSRRWLAKGWGGGHQLSNTPWAPAVSHPAQAGVERPGTPGQRGVRVKTTSDEGRAAMQLASGE